jgi:hypothetical protein
MTRAEAYWQKFIDHLNEVDPLIFYEKKTKFQLPHQNFLGSTEKYKDIFMDVNQPKAKRKK